MLKYIHKKSHHVITSGGADATLLYNEPRELIDPSDPVMSKELFSELISSEKHESKLVSSYTKWTIKMKRQMIDPTLSVLR